MLNPSKYGSGVHSLTGLPLILVNPARNGVRVNSLRICFLMEVNPVRYGLVVHVVMSGRGNGGVNPSSLGATSSRGILQLCVRTKPSMTLSKISVARSIWFDSSQITSST
ncbi:hypothetical protein D3C86_1404740 [compost metagenome]